VANILTPVGFLRFGGVILLVLGWLGYLLAPISEGELLGSALWFDGGENIAHSVLGVLALVFAADFKPDWQRWIVAALGVVALFFGVYGFVAGPGDMTMLNTFGVANLENPLDNLLHLVVGAWALYAAFRAEASPAT
jgi:hypothetical protein